MSDLSTRTLEILQANSSGITRRGLVYAVTGIWTPDHDRAVRLALSSLHKQGHDVISYNGMYYLVTADTPLEAVKAYTRRELSAAKNTIKRCRRIMARFPELHTEPMADQP